MCIYFKNEKRYSAIFKHVLKFRIQTKCCVTQLLYAINVIKLDTTPMICGLLSKYCYNIVGKG